MMVAVGVIAIVLGTVLRWALSGSAAGVDLGAVGTVLLVVGAIELVLAAALRRPARAMVRATNEPEQLGPRDRRDREYDDRRAA